MGVEPILLFKQPVISGTIIKLIYNSDEASENRNKWERYWMARLNSYVPYGMNIQE